MQDNAGSHPLKYHYLQTSEMSDATRYRCENQRMPKLPSVEPTTALQAAREALRLALSTPRIGAMLKEIDKELSVP